MTQVLHYTTFLFKVVLPNHIQIYIPIFKTSYHLIYTTRIRWSVFTRVMPACSDEGLSVREHTCRDSVAATELKLVAIIAIFVTSVAGISSPMILAKSLAGKPIYEKAIMVIKCYAAGVILSTALVHMLPDALDALRECVVSTLHP